MIIPLFFYAQCDPTYQRKVLDKLEKEFAQVKEMPYDEFSEENAYRITNVVYKYEDRYLIPREYWDKWKDSLFDPYDYNSKVYDELWNEDIAMDHFIQDGIDGYTFERDHPTYYLMNSDNTSAIGDQEPVLDFPHDDIYRMFSYSTKRDMTHHPSTELVNKYERMTKLYAEIKAAEDDSEKWLKVLLTAFHDKFLRSNVEYRLGNNLLDKQLWKLYIGYLKDRDPKAMLIVYSKYVRFFMDDNEMLKEYQQQMEEYGPVELFWKKLFEFEKKAQISDTDESGDEADSDGMDEDINNAGEEESDDMDEDMLSSSEEKEDDSDNMDVAQTPFNSQICATFFNNVNRQKDLSFLKPTIDYLLKDAPPAILQKLFKSGKYFFARNRTPICYRLKIHNGATVFNDECVDLDIANKNVLNRVYISTTLSVQYCRLWIDPWNYTIKNYISSLIPHLFQCDAKFILLGFQNLSFKELKFLIGSGQCLELELWKCEIKDEHGEYIDLERITEFLPEIKHLSLPTVKVNSNTANALSAQKFDNKFFRIEIQNIIGKPFDAEEFKHFIIAKRRARFIIVDLSFDKTFDAGFVGTLKQILDEYRKICDDESRLTVEIK